LIGSTDGHHTIAEGIDMTSVADLGLAHLRVARPTDDLEEDFARRKTSHAL
jgi:hypothetical protein